MAIKNKWLPMLPVVALFLFFNTSRSFSSVNKDSLLIADMNVQIEATQALNDMYNFKFDQAMEAVYWLMQNMGPSPTTFSDGLNEWWQIMPNLDVETHDMQFVAYMDSAIVKAKKLYKVDSFKVEGAFFLAASYGFKARLYSERRKWLKAAGNANKALNYLEDCRSKEELSPELLFGDGLYNYFSVWIPENYPQIRPFLIMFNKGEKDKGLEQLEEVAHNAFTPGLRPNSG